MLDENYLDEVTDWLQDNISEIHVKYEDITSMDEVELAIKRINLFIDSIEQKQREIDLRMKDIRLRYDKEQPSRGILFNRTKKGIDYDRKRILNLYRQVKKALDWDLWEWYWNKMAIRSIGKELNKQSKDRNRN